MPIDIALTALAMPITEFPSIAREAEVRGYRTAWVGEASGAEAIVLSTLIATHTAKLQIANGVIPAQTRTPIVYGQAAATLAHLAPRRFALGLSLSSEIIVGQWHGLPFAPSIQQMREAVQIIRTVAAGERVTFEGKFYRLKNFRLAIPAPTPPPRIYLAALGPRMCELGGEIADGVLLNWIPPEAVETSLAHVETGAKRAGRRLADVDVAVYVRTCVTDERAPARTRLGPRPQPGRRHRCARAVGRAARGQRRRPDPARRGRGAGRRDPEPSRDAGRRDHAEPGGADDPGAPARPGRRAARPARPDRRASGDEPAAAGHRAARLRVGGDAREAQELERHHDPVDDPRRAGARSSRDPPGELEALPGGGRGLGRAQGRPRPDRRGREPARRVAYPAGGAPLRAPRHPVPAGLAPATVRRGALARGPGA